MNSEKPFSAAVSERHATRHFDPTPIDEADLLRILEAGRAAPSGYNLQPWRFVVVRDPEQRHRLREAAMGQPKVEEAPTVLVACGDPLGWRQGDLDDLLKLSESAQTSTEQESTRRNVTKFLSTPGNHGGIGPDLSVWVNRQVMIAFTTMMWMAEVLGYDTAPMEGFWEDKVRSVLGIPDHVRVVALLAIGRRLGGDRPFGGRFPLSHSFFGERWGESLNFNGGKQ